jgi:hypothetical protein
MMGIALKRIDAGNPATHDGRTDASGLHMSK